MTVSSYFDMIIWILMGLAFIAISLIFLYMIYGEKEPSRPSSLTKNVKFTNIFQG